jgi:hypothetical protein
MKSKISIIGVEYKIIADTYENEKCYKKRNINGFCDVYTKEIHFLKLDTVDSWKHEPKETKTQCENTAIRHEIVHAFLYESGLNQNAITYGGAWSRNEEMVDWLAIQITKINEVYEELDLL